MHSTLKVILVNFYASIHNDMNKQYDIPFLKLIKEMNKTIYYVFLLGYKFKWPFFFFFIFVKPTAASSIYGSECEYDISIQLKILKHPPTF